MAPSAYNNVDPIEDESHQIISSYFIGPQAENIEFFKQTVNEILDAQEKARHDYFPGDGVGHDGATVTLLISTLEIHYRKSSRFDSIQTLD